MIAQKTLKSGTVKISKRFLENPWIPLINYKVNLIVTCYANCFIAAETADGRVSTFATTDTKLYNSVITLST